MSQRQYIAIDLKSFYASVECVERGLNPLDSCLVVADKSRTDKTICLAVSAALKGFGVPGRPRLFEVVQRVREVNRSRGKQRSSTSLKELSKNINLSVDYIVAPPRMQVYLDYSTRIYEIYLKYVSAEDIHVYSIDEVLIDVTAYLKTYKLSAHQLAMMMIKDVLTSTGITATCGIGSNMYLCKVAMDIMAKKMTPDSDGVRITELDEQSYRRQLWSHTPLTDFWRVGRGIARVLNRAGIYTMGDIARLSLKYEDWFYDRFGINAELLIDHAWGWEPVTMDMVKAYRPETHSISSGQVLHEPYTFDKARVVIQEMADSIALELVEKSLLTNQIVLTVGYDIENLNDDKIRRQYHGRTTTDHYGRQIPYHAHGTVNFDRPTASATEIIEKVVTLYETIVNPILLIRRLTLSINNLKRSSDIISTEPHQLDLFTDYDEFMKSERRKRCEEAKEYRRQTAIINLHNRFGKNSILKGLHFAEGATQRQRNGQIGGHKA